MTDPRPHAPHDDARDEGSPADLIHFDRQPRLTDGRLVVGLGGWMDGGDVSTGTVEWLIEQGDAQPIAEINPEPFYIYNMPGSMEVAALFRPQTRIENGLVTDFEPPVNTLYHSESFNLLLLLGREPHLRWPTYADCLFEIAHRCGINEFHFAGSVAGVVPHTRPPRLRAGASDDSVRQALVATGLDMTEYEGPASFSAQLLFEANDAALQMTHLVAEIPAYIQGRNPKAIEAILRKLGVLLDLPFELEELRKLGDHWEKRIDQAVAQRQDLAEHIHKLEEDYDHEVFDTQMPDLKDWLEQQGIQLD